MSELYRNIDSEFSQMRIERMASPHERLFGSVVISTGEQFFKRGGAAFASRADLRFAPQAMV